MFQIKLRSSWKNFTEVGDYFVLLLWCIRISYASHTCKNVFNMTELINDNTIETVEQTLPQRPFQVYEKFWVTNNSFPPLLNKWILTESCWLECTNIILYIFPLDFVIEVTIQSKTEEDRRETVYVYGYIKKPFINLADPP